VVWAVCALAAASSDAGDPRAPARFRVTTDVVNAGLGPFNATVGGMGNSLWNCSFEPAEFRTRFFAEGDAPDRVPVSAKALGHYNSLREGFYDGATVRVYRPVNGRIELVRRDTVPAGGSHLSGWVPVTEEGALIVPGSGRGAYRFDDWNRPGVPYYFTLRAVNREGRESEAAPAAAIVKSAEKSDGVSDFVTAPFQAPARAAAAEGKAPAAPRGFKGRLDPDTNLAVFEWVPLESEDLAGYRLYVSDYAPDAQRGHELRLAGRPADSNQWVRKGDWVVAAKTFDTFSRNTMLANRVWGANQNNRLAMPQGVPFYPDEDPSLAWTLERYPKTCPVTNGGLAALKLTLRDNKPVRFTQYNHAGTNQTWYPVLEPGKPYAVEVWLKQEGMADPTFTFSLTGFYGDRVKPIDFTAGGQWQLHRATFAVPALWDRASGVGQMVLAFRGPGTVWMDNLRVYQADVPFLDLLPYEYASLAASGMSALRTHGFIKTGMGTYGLDLLTNPGGAASGTVKENTLPQVLAIMRQAKVTPWLQIEMHFSPEEWLGLVEYLAAPYDPATDTPDRKPWAHKRFAQGQARPWTDEFDTILFEISNETWNWLFNPWVFEGMADAATGVPYDRGEVYGLYQEHVRDAMAQSPYWQPAGLDRKLRFAIGGWAINNYGTQAASRSPHSRYLTIAAYNGGWDEGEGPSAGDDASLWRVLLNPPQSAAPRAAQLRADRDRLRAAGHPDLDLGTYEAGPGYALSGLNKQPRMSPAEVLSQERTMKSLAGGTATLDTFLTYARQGFVAQNFFTFHHGRTHWVSHTAWHNGSRAHPCWMSLALFNREGTGDLLDVQTLGAPATDVPAYKRRKAARDVPLVAAYATRRGDRVNLFLLSRRLDRFPDEADDGFTPVTVDLPFAKAARVTCHRIAGDPRLTNLDAERVRIETVAVPAELASGTFTLSARTAADDRGLPPGSTYLYVFEGVTM
jgi:hypothetical protein